jgi:hypothetical protein
MNNEEVSICGVIASFIRWSPYNDNIGSYCNEVIQKIEEIQGEYFKTYTFSGMLSTKPGSVAGCVCEPDLHTLEVMKKMDSFSFTVLGDGNSYNVAISTKESKTKGENSHFRKIISTKNSEIITYNIDLNELSQDPIYGKPVPFIKNNIESLQFHVLSTAEFNLKVWNINIYG